LSSSTSSTSPSPSPSPPPPPPPPPSSAAVSLTPALTSPAQSLPHAPPRKRSRMRIEREWQQARQQQTKLRRQPAMRQQGQQLSIVFLCSGSAIPRFLNPLPLRSHPCHTPPHGR
jgi:hypothetical protein